MTPRRNIELSELQKLFHLTEKQVAKELGVCLTSLKKICRQHGIHRWPYRKVCIHASFQYVSHLPASVLIALSCSAALVFTFHFAAESQVGARWRRSVAAFAACV